MHSGFAFCGIGCVGGHWKVGGVSLEDLVNFFSLNVSLDNDESSDAHTLQPRGLQNNSNSKPSQEHLIKTPPLSRLNIRKRCNSCLLSDQFETMKRGTNSIFERRIVRKKVRTEMPEALAASLTVRLILLTARQLRYSKF